MAAWIDEATELKAKAMFRRRLRAEEISTLVEAPVGVVKEICAGNRWQGRLVRRLLAEAVSPQQISQSTGLPHEALGVLRNPRREAQIRFLCGQRPSVRQVARLLQIARGTAAAIRRGRSRPRLAPEKQDQEFQEFRRVPEYRCPRCRRRVYLFPCVACASAGPTGTGEQGSLG